MRGSCSRPDGPTSWPRPRPRRASGPSTVVCDVRRPEQCDAVVRDAVEQLGGLDVVVYATAVDPLVRLVDTDAERWRDVYETNVFGASLVTRAALAPLTESRRAHGLHLGVVGGPTAARAWVPTRPARPRSTSWCGRGGASTRRSASATSRWATRSAPRCTSRGTATLLGELSPVWESRGYVHDNGPGAMSVDDCATAVLAAITSPVDLRYVVANPAPGSTMDMS